MPTQQFFSYILREWMNYQWNDDEVCFVLDQHALLDFNSTSSADGHVAYLSLIILIPSQPVFALSP